MTEKGHFSHFSHRECEYYPCHMGADPESFNCLFCYCPLYALGDKCGGNFRFTDSGIKDCSACLIPHSRGGYDYVTGKFGDIIDLIRERREEKKD